VATVALNEPVEDIDWKRRLAPYMMAHDRTAWFQLLSTLGLFALVWSVTYLGVEHVGWWVALALAPLTGLLMVRVFIVQHDCGHGSFFRSKTMNDRVGAWLGILTLTPYHYWKRTHAVHHASSGDLDRRGMGDIATLTVAEYRSRPWRSRLAYRLYRHPLVLLGLGPVYLFLLKHRLPLDIPRSWRREWRSVMVTDAAIAAVLVAAWATIGLDRFLLIQLPVAIAMGTAGVWLFYVQHQFEDTFWARRADWSFAAAALEGSSFYDLPPVLHWFTGNIGYHHIHHLASRIPNYRLPACFREVPELQNAPRLTLAESLRCLRLRLWNEDARRLVGFRGL
jgi:omega-6 fatty acid desaturase (delta-12 desaturase)